VAAKAKRRRDDRSGASSSRARPGAPNLRRKSCQFCKHHVDDVDYKDVSLLRRYISERGKIRSRRMTGTCRKHQRLVAIAVKRAREMALLPYVTDGGPPTTRPRSGSREDGSSFRQTS
jgi:small subunit ribosomal protein S18